MKLPAKQMKFNSYCEENQQSLATPLSANNLTHKMKKVVFASVLDFTLYFRVILLPGQASTLS